MRCMYSAMTARFGGGNGMNVTPQLPIGEVPHPIFTCFGTGIYSGGPPSNRPRNWGDGWCLHLFSALHTTRSHRAVKIPGDSPSYCRIQSITSGRKGKWQLRAWRAVTAPREDGKSNRDKLLGGWVFSWPVHATPHAPFFPGGCLVRPSTPGEWPSANEDLLQPQVWPEARCPGSGLFRASSWAVR